MITQCHQCLYGCYTGTPIPRGTIRFHRYAGQDAERPVLDEAVAISCVESVSNPSRTGGGALARDRFPSVRADEDPALVPPRAGRSRPAVHLWRAELTDEDPPSPRVTRHAGAAMPGRYVFPADHQTSAVPSLAAAVAFICGGKWPAY
jgi:hypothetical protein